MPPRPEEQVIETPRLLMRPHRLEDFAPCAAMWADPEVTRYIGGKPFTREEVWTKLLRFAGLWSLLGYGYWAVVEKTSGEYIGELGFADFQREIDPLMDSPEMGWVLAKRAHGKGYATEGVRAALDWADAHLPVTGTCCLIHPENAASLRIAAKCGFQQVRESMYKGQMIGVYARSRNA